MARDDLPWSISRPAAGTMRPKFTISRRLSQQSRGMFSSSSSKSKVPVEIWSMILRLATIIPGGLSMDFESFIDFFSVKWELEDAYRPALDTKWNLITVSSDFHALSLPFLYELINIERASQLLKLLQCVRARRNSEVPVGPLIRRIEIKDHPSLHFNVHGTCSILSELLSLCPRLRICCGDMLLLLPRGTSILIPCMPTSSIERIGIRIVLKEDADEFSSILPSLPRLKALRIRMMGTGSKSLILRSESLVILSTNLDPNCQAKSIRSWKLPSIAHLALIAPTEAQFTNFMPFFQSHGGQLISCHIYEPEHSTALLTHIFACFPNLLSLAYPFSIHPLIPEGLTMRNLREIGWTLDPNEADAVDGNISNMMVLECRDLERQAVLLPPSLVPALRQIRLQYMYFDTLGPNCCVPGSSYISLSQTSKCVDTPQKRREREWWSYYCHKWKSRGIDIRDREGFLLNLEARNDEAPSTSI